MKSNPPPPKASLGFGITRKAEEYRYRSDDESPAPRKPKVLVVDDDPAMRRLMATRLGAANYEVETVGDAPAALDACVTSRPHLVIADLRLKDTDGLAFLKELRSRWPQLTVIILTAHGTISEAVQATQCGAFGYLVKPVDRDELLAQVKRATAGSIQALTEADWRANFVLRSQLMEDRLGLANRAAGSDVPVLLTGENGTGKELLARAIHAASARRAAPFVAVSCRNEDPRAMTADLFGEPSEEPGMVESITAGALQRARGGTLYLEEIADLPMDVQLALAKALAKADVPSGKWLGAVRADVRLISTTSRDLKVLVETGAFLRDLYYQLNILPIEIPPLGRRREDIPVLISHFLEQATEPGGETKIYSPQAIERLATADWPGKVRQLFDLVKQNVALSHAENVPTYSEARDNFSRAYLSENLQRTAGNVTEAARLAKRSRTDFYKLLARHRLHVDDFKKPSSDRDPDDENE